MKNSIIRAVIFVLIFSMLNITNIPEPVSAASAIDGFKAEANGSVKTVVLQPDGKILVGGEFTTLCGVARNHIGRLNPDGTLDEGFDPDANATVQIISIQEDGKILVGGIFTELGGTARDYIGRLNEDGSLDTDYDPGAGSFVMTLAVQPDGKALVGGFFTELGGSARNYIGRLNPDGSIDSSFTISASYWVTAIKIQTDGKIIVGGMFTQLGGVNRSYIGRINRDGSLDTDFNPSANNSVNTIAIRVDHKIVIGGYFTEIDGQGHSKIAMLNQDGSLDTTFNANLGSDEEVSSLTLQSDGKIVVGGNFSQINGEFRNHIGRLNSDGSLDEDFDPNANGGMYAMAIQPDGKILLGGYFSCVGGACYSRITRLNPDGNHDSDFVSGSTNYYSIYAQAIQTDGKILVGGGFSSISGVPRDHLARLETNGFLDITFNPGADQAVYGFAVLPDEKIIVIGGFSELGGVTRHRIGRLNPDGTIDETFPDIVIDGWGINALAIQPDGKILIGGDFTSVGGYDRDQIARLNSDGTVDLDFDPGAGSSSQVLQIHLQEDGKILVAGSFLELGGLPCSYIGRLNTDGTRDTSFTAEANNSVYSIAQQADGKIVVGGDFNYINGVSHKKIGRLNLDGSLDTSFSPVVFEHYVRAVAVQLDGKILLGGNFSLINSVGRNYIGRLNQDGSLDETFDPGANLNVDQISVQWDGKVLTSGSFYNLDGQTRYSIGRLSADEVVHQDIVAASDGSALTWQRSGAGPVFFRTTFEKSSDGVTYAPLGEGTRTQDGWQVSGLDLALFENFYIRVRGYVSDGSSQSIVERVQVMYLENPPEITSEDHATFTVGEPGSFSITTTGSPTAEISLSGDLPDGLIFTDNEDGTATLSGTPSSGSEGVYSLVITATNGSAPDAEQEFSLAVNLVETIGTDGGTVTDPDQGVNIDVPAGAVDCDVDFTFLPQTAPDHSTGSLNFADVSFQLTASESISGAPVTVFSEPLVVRIDYEEPLADGNLEESLALYYWNETSWEDVVTTCASGEYTRNLEENWFSVGICHLSEFAVLGESGYSNFLPLILN